MMIHAATIASFQNVVMVANIVTKNVMMVKMMELNANMVVRIMSVEMVLNPNMKNAMMVIKLMEMVVPIYANFLNAVMELDKIQRNVTLVIIMVMTKHVLITAR